ncbi:DddA-like double-stranded DNA deaminase toxin [Glycomyces sp. NPDC048151]|uniref:DddA-like double-stranded DNA deaminase toxin n=1 Tax=Glycomyces sp. NPDC048151 TaxID=3364002 RepID=UPI0037113383
MASIDTLIASIHSAINQAANLLAGIARSAEQTTQTRSRAGQLGIERTAERLTTAADSLAEGQALARAIADRLQSALAAAEAARTGNGDGRPPVSTSTPEPSQQPRRHPWADHPPVPGFKPSVPHKTCIEETRRVGWPVNKNGRVAARGRLYDSDGRPITGTVQAGNGPAAKATDLKEPWASDERMTTRWHIEGHAAAIMRIHALKEAVLYINLPPCGRADQDQWRCDPNLAKLVPVGSTLKVWIVPEKGAPQMINYRGSGEAIT